ncbi:Fpg/Nei family DNA glycosylase [Acidimicrobiaceae bacterium USS-CC1]|uniref:Fpg/Nei family DNA glycosylase n=1 Tax=Acidiferrimicrobium australe TaxID=2664430 RepID=A0ABW9QRI1_9ACTN|nr:Fpg/Nei family DNA glycosylase [Acidiferrimicrobium australe]
MPELPEVEALARFLTDRAAGRVLERVEVAALAALKTFDPPVESLVGRRVEGCGRRGKYLCVGTTGPGEPVWLVVHLARGGWVRWRDEAPAARAKPGKGPLALRVGLSEGGFDLTEAGTEKRLGVWVVHDPARVEGVARLGVDPLSAAFTVDALATLLAERPGTVKNVLVDQSAIAGIGNAYSDEALHAARLSPFKPAGRLGGEDVARLHDAVVAVLTDAVERSLGLPAKGLKAEKRSGLAVHGRAGLPCPVCGDTVREVSFATKSLQYCPTCQTGGKPLADRRLSRLLK